MWHWEQREARENRKRKWRKDNHKEVSKPYLQHNSTTLVFLAPTTYPIFQFMMGIALQRARICCLHGTNPHPSCPLRAASYCLTAAFQCPRLPSCFPPSWIKALAGLLMSNREWRVCHAYSICGIYCPTLAVMGPDPIVSVAADTQFVERQTHIRVRKGNDTIDPPVHVPSKAGLLPPLYLQVLCPAQF